MIAPLARSPHMKTTLVTLAAGLALVGCGGKDGVSAAASEPQAKLIVRYEGNPSLGDGAKLFVTVIAPNDAVSARGKVDDLSIDERILTLREPELIGFSVHASRTRRGAALDPECGRMFNVEAGESAEATISLSSLSRVRPSKPPAGSCRVTR